MPNQAHARRVSRQAHPRIISHRAGTKAARAHEFVRINREREASEVMGEMEKRFKVTKGTARNWYQTFKKHPMDFSPRAS